MGGVLLKSVPNVRYARCGYSYEYKGDYRFHIYVLYIVFLIAVFRVSSLTCVLYVLSTLAVTG